MEENPYKPPERINSSEPSIHGWTPFDIASLAFQACLIGAAVYGLVMLAMK
jgi:hypothetical protein